MQVGEVLIRLEFRGPLGVTKQTIHGPSQHHVALLEVRNATGPFTHGLHGVEGGGPSLGHGGQRLLFKFGHALDGRDKVWNQVETTLVLRFDIGPLSIDVFVEGNEAVVAAHGADADEGDQREGNDPNEVLHVVNQSFKRGRHTLLR